jgi:hypothetical protein
MDFDERDLFEWAERAGFASISLVLEAKQGAQSRELTTDWDTLLRTSGNPLDPTVGETIAASLSSEEAAKLEAHLRPLVEAGDASSREAHAYLTATK